MHRRPLALAPSVRPRAVGALTGSAAAFAAAGGSNLEASDIERTLVLATLTNRVALALHGAPLNASDEAAEGQRHPMRVGTGAANLQAWVRHLVPPVIERKHKGRLQRLKKHLRRGQLDEPASTTSSPASALLLINKGPQPAIARLPRDAASPYQIEQLFVLSAWGNTSTASATGVPPGTSLTQISHAIDVPPYDAVLYLLFTTQSAAQEFDLGGMRVRGGADPSSIAGGDAARGGPMSSQRVGGALRSSSGSVHHVDSFWDPLSRHPVSVLVAFMVLVIGLILRKFRQGQENGGLTRWEQYAHTRLVMDSPGGDRPGTESKRKGRGRNTRPRLPHQWVPNDTPVHAPSSRSPKLRSSSSVDEYYEHECSSPIPFNLANEPSAVGPASVADNSSLSTRRGFGCSPSFQDLDGRPPPSARPAGDGPPLIGRPSDPYYHV